MTPTWFPNLPGRKLDDRQRILDAALLIVLTDSVTVARQTFTVQEDTKCQSKQESGSRSSPAPALGLAKAPPFVSRSAAPSVELELEMCSETGAIL